MDHACSVGEVKSSYGIVKFMKDNYKVLITTILIYHP